LPQTVFPDPPPKVTRDSGINRRGRYRLVGNSSGYLAIDPLFSVGMPQDTATLVILEEDSGSSAVP